MACCRLDILLLVAFVLCAQASADRLSDTSQSERDALGRTLLHDYHKKKVAERKLQENLEDRHDVSDGGVGSIISFGRQLSHHHKKKVAERKLQENLEDRHDVSDGGVGSIISFGRKLSHHHKKKVAER